MKPTTEMFILGMAISWLLRLALDWGEIILENRKLKKKYGVD